MRKLILSMNMSLDGYVAGLNGDSSWQDVDNPGNWEDLLSAMQQVDLFVLGAGMWPEYSGYWKSVLISPDPSKYELSFAKFAEHTKHIVFSKTITDAGWENANIDHGDLAASLQQLKARPGGDIMSFGGAAFATSLLNTGLVDEYRLVLSPAILAGGKPLFANVVQGHKLSLAEVNKFDELVALTYRQLGP